MERRRLGDERRAGEDGLVEGSVRGGVQRVPHRRLRGVGAGQVLRDTGEAVVGSEGVPGSGRRAVQAAQMGPAEVHHLQLLH